MKILSGFSENYCFAIWITRQGTKMWVFFEVGKISFSKVLEKKSQQRSQSAITASLLL